MPTVTPLPTPTPAPRVELVLAATSEIEGYWSDGSGNVTVSVTLRNDGLLQHDAPTSVDVGCIPALAECRQEMVLTLPDGYAAAASAFTMRAPLGTTIVTFGYGNEERQLDVVVQERVLGVDRDLWECYSHRSDVPVMVEGESLFSCSGWEVPGVVKWLNDAPIKVWANDDGNPVYIAILKTVLGELSSLMDLEFEWVESEEAADLLAHAGIPKSLAPDLGFARLTEYGGIGSASVRSGEIISGEFVVWERDTDTARDLAQIRSITLHEALHSLAALSHSTRPGSIVGRSGLTKLSPRDAGLLRLNSHRLLLPGMSMQEVRDVIVLEDELLDAVHTSVPSSAPIDLIWRAYVGLAEAGSATFQLSGGWLDHDCNYTFGRRRGPITILFGDFGLFKNDPAQVYLDIHTARFYVAYSRNQHRWLHWEQQPDGAWVQVDRAVVDDATYWWLWSGKLHKTLRSLIIDGIPPDASVTETDAGQFVVRVAVTPATHPALLVGEHDRAVEFELVVDQATGAIEGYTWEFWLDPVGQAGKCLHYKEQATDGQLAANLDLPDSIRAALK